MRIQDIDCEMNHVSHKCTVWCKSCQVKNNNFCYFFHFFVHPPWNIIILEPES